MFNHNDLSHKTYTVVGYFNDNNQPWACRVEAENPSNAAHEAIRELLNINDWDAEDIDRIEVVSILSGAATPAVAMPEVAGGSHFFQDILASLPA